MAGSGSAAGFLRWQGAFTRDQHWSPDGRQLTFVNGQQIFEWDEATARAVYTMLPKLSGPGESSRIGGLAMVWDNGRARAVSANIGADSDIWSLPLDPLTHLAIGPPTRRGTSTAFERHPRLSPNGRQLAFISGRSGGPALWIADRGITPYLARQTLTA